MSSVDTSMSSSDLNEKGPIDFAVKAVTLKPTDTSRILQTGVLRTFPSLPSSRQGPYPPQQPTSSTTAPQKTVYSRVVSAPAATTSGMSSGTAVTAKSVPPLSVATSAPGAAPGSHPTTTYLIPRGGMQVTSTIQPRPSATLTRATMTIQSLTNTMVRAPANHVRAPSPARPSVPRPTGKPVQPRADHQRPIVVPAQTVRPLTLTNATQLHIPEKGMKMPVGSLQAQVLPIRTPFGAVPTFVGPNQTTTILQRADVPATVLTGSLPVRLTPPLAPLLTTQRVAVSVATVSTRLAVPQPMHTSAPNIHRAPTQALGPRGAGASNPQNMPKMSVPSIPPVRVAYVHTTIPRTSTQVTSTQANSKPVSTTTTMVTSGARMTLPNHQPRPTQSQNIQGPVVPPTGLLLHPQLVVSTTTVRPTLVPSSGPKTQVIQHSLPASIQLSTTTKSSSIFTSSSSITTLTSKPAETYKVGSSVSLTRIGGPPAKTYPIGSQSHPPILSIPESDAPPHLSTTVFIPAPPPPRTNPSPGVITTQGPERHTYTLPGGTAYFYEAPSGYQLATDAPLVARPLSPDTSLPPRQLASDGPLIARPFTPGTVPTSAQTMRYNPLMLVESINATVTPVATTESSATDSKLLTSPRPSILRKRDSEGNINVKAVKNLTPALCGRSRSPSPPPPPPPASSSLHCETTPAANPAPPAEVGPSSNGSTTMSASSSPVPDESADADRGAEMSPRKKPRKQLLNDANDANDMEFLSAVNIKDKIASSKVAELKEDVETDSSTAVTSVPPACVLKKPPAVSLLRSYKHTWKLRHNHFKRYKEIKVREERRPSVTEIANQKQILQRVNGWKVYHLSTQFENLEQEETAALERLSAIFKEMDTNLGKECTKDVDRVNELIMGNIQRSKVIRDQMSETRVQLMKGFEHKVHVSEILTRCASKRNFKKRDKY